MAVSVLDADSPLGAELCRALGDEALPVRREEIDFSAGEQIFRLLLRLQPTAVINVASYSDIELAEAEPERCFSINAAAVKRIVEVCALLHCPLVNLSTDHVFGADSGRYEPYRESDPTSPRSVYAHSKRAGEVYAAGWHRHFIVRTADLYGRPAGAAAPDLLDRLLESCATHAQQGSELPAVRDQYCTPTYIPHLAQAILHLLKNSQEYGTYHVVNSGFTNWFEFAEFVCQLKQVTPPLKPVTRAEAGISPLWPRFSVLDSSRYQSTDGPKMPSWQAAVAERLGGTAAPGAAGAEP